MCGAQVRCWAYPRLNPTLLILHLGPSPHTEPLCGQSQAPGSMEEPEPRTGLGTLWAVRQGLLLEALMDP